MTFVSFASRGETAPWRYLASFVAALGLAVLLVVVAATAMVLGHYPVDRFAADIQNPGQPVTFFLMNGALFGLLLVAFALAARWIQKKRFGDIAGRWSLRDFGKGFAVWCVVLVALAAVDFAIQPHGFTVAAGPGTLGLALAALVGLAVQTLTEEFVFRGFLTQGLLLAIRRPVPAAVVSGLLFGALHIPNGPPQAASATLFGIILALIAIRRGGIAFTWGLHLANNLFAAVVVVSGGDAFRGAPALFAQNTPRLMWWDAASGALALLLLGSALLWLERHPTENPA